MVIIDTTNPQDFQLEQKMGYENDIQKCNDDVRLFYVHGYTSFLSVHNIGDRETFYMHTLRCYLPVIVDDTWKKYNFGIGILTMQGVERRNKESKYTMTNYTNHRGNVVIQTLYRLWDIFSCMSSKS